MDSLQFLNIRKFEWMAKKLDDDCLVTCDMGVWFRLEKINSNQSFRRKLTALFQGIFFHDCRVIRRAGRTYYRIIIDKTNLVNLLESRNLGHSLYISAKLSGCGISIVTAAEFHNEEKNSFF